MTGVDTQKDMESRQNSVLSAILDAALLNKIYNDSFTEGTDILKLDAYLNTVFKNIWTPLVNKNELKNKLRRTLECNYLIRINGLLNPEKKDGDKGNGNVLKQVLGGGGSSAVLSPDAILYMLQHLNKIESHCKAMSASATGINKQHYDELLQQIKLIRERRTTVK